MLHCEPDTGTKLSQAGVPAHDGSSKDEEAQAHLLCGEGLPILIEADEPEFGDGVVLVVGDEQVVGPCLDQVRSGFCGA